MMLYIIGIGFFGWMLGSLSLLLKQIDSISEFKQEHIDFVDSRILKISKSNRHKVFSKEYKNSITSFNNSKWDLNFDEVEKSEFFY